VRSLVLTLLLAGVGASSALAADTPGSKASQPGTEAVPERQPTLPVEGTMLRVEL
jgi:hypothetical protein